MSQDLPGASMRDYSIDAEWLYERPVDNEFAPATTERNIGSVARGFLWCEPIWIGLLAPLVLWPGRFIPWIFHPLIVLALLLFWPLRLLIQRRLTPRTPIDSMLLILVLLVPVSLWLSPHSSISWEAAGYLLLGISVYVAAVNWPIMQSYPWLTALGICLTGILLAVVGPSIVASAPNKLFESPELQPLVQVSTEQGRETVNTNVLAGGLAFVIPILFALALHGRLLSRSPDPTRDRFVNISLSLTCGLLAIGMGFVVVVTQSRGAYIAVLISLWLIVWLRWPRLWPIMISIFTSVIVGIYWFGINAILEQELFGTSVSLVGRIAIWKRGVSALYDFAYSGIGIGTFGNTVTNGYPYSLFANHSIPHVHNMLLQIGLDLGIVGLAAYIGLIVGILMLCSQVIGTQRGRKPELNVALAIGGIGSVSVLMIHGLFDSVLWGTKLSPLPWLLFSLVVLLPHDIERRRRSRSRR